MSGTLTALGLDASRSLDPSRYAMSGVAPRLAVRPASRDEAAETLRAAARDGLRVVPWGGGVSLPAEAAPANYDVALDLSALTAIVEYQPDDLTLTAECGVTIGALRAELGRRGQELPLEAANASRATLGGALAANASGPRRRRFGAPRDRVIGARYLLGDGSGARSGGKVVKNVAGYGIHRLLCGSRGGLAVILEASLKLQPAPATRAALIYGVDAAALRDRARWSNFARLEPAALSVMSADRASGAGLDSAGAPFTAVIAFEDDAAWAAEQERVAIAALGAPSRRLEGGDVGAALERLADLEEVAGPRFTFTTADATPAALAPLLDFGAAGPFVFHAFAGRLHVWPAADGAQALVGLLAESDLGLADARGFTALEPALPPQAAALAMRAGLREAFDPGRRFALGERWQAKSL